MEAAKRVSKIGQFVVWDEFFTPNLAHIALFNIFLEHRSRNLGHILRLFITILILLRCQERYSLRNQFYF